MRIVTKYQSQSGLQNTALSVIILLSVVLAGCGLLESDSEDGNAKLGGSTSTEFTNIGDHTDVIINLKYTHPAFERVQDSVVVVANQNGDVTWYAKFRFDTVVSKTLDTILGMQELPAEPKKAILDALLQRYGATLDTSDKDNMWISATLKGRVTSEGIQEYVSSGGDLSKPFTIVRYNANVGDVYRFKRPDGVEVTRTVTSKSTTDDYPIAFWLIKVIKVEETSNDPFIKKITYITNHKFGLVGIEIETIDGFKTKVGLWPPNL